MLNESSEWEGEDWLHSAKKLVQWASEATPDSRLMLLVRHSHRKTIENHTAQLSTELTPLGYRMSTEMGRRLALDRKTWIFFSFVTRCYQTADEMGKGLVEKGGVVEDLDTLAVLATPEVKDQEFWNELQPDGKNITDFVNRWGDGVFEEMVEPFDDYKGRLLNDTVERLREVPDGTMHIHITHDLALMATKRILLGRAVNISDREPFLGGIGVMLKDRRMTLYSSGEVFPLDTL